MNTRIINRGALIASVAIMLSACFGGGSSGTVTTVNTDTVTTPPVTTDTVATDTGPTDTVTTDATTTGSEELGSPLIQSAFAFPDVQLSNGTDVENFSAPLGPLPEFSARRTLSAGSGDVVAFGDPVQLKYNMYSWTSGELVETTDEFDEAVIINAGIAEGVPAFLSSSVLGRNKGEMLQIVYEAGMEDLPGYLDNSDAYVMVLEVL